VWRLAIQVHRKFGSRGTPSADFHTSLLLCPVRFAFNSVIVVIYKLHCTVCTLAQSCNTRLLSSHIITYRSFRFFLFYSVLHPRGICGPRCRRLRYILQSVCLSSCQSVSHCELLTEEHKFKFSTQSQWSVASRFSDENGSAFHAEV